MLILNWRIDLFHVRQRPGADRPRRVALAQLRPRHAMLAEMLVEFGTLARNRLAYRAYRNDRADLAAQGDAPGVGMGLVADFSALLSGENQIDPWRTSARGTNLCALPTTPIGQTFPGLISRALGPRQWTKNTSILEPGWGENLSTPLALSPKPFLADNL